MSVGVGGVRNDTDNLRYGVDCLNKRDVRKRDSAGRGPPL